MSDNTAIEWTNHTFNPWWGCSRVSPGCRFCYADRDAQRYGHQVWRRHGPRRMLSEANWHRPLKWNRDAERAGVPAKVFCASMADVFEDHPEVTEARERLWGVIEATPWLTWQLLTKRPENVAWLAPWGDDWPSNVWLGTSTEDGLRADQRISRLFSIPARVRFISAEPLLGALNLWRWINPSVPCVDCDICGEERFPDEIGFGHDRYVYDEKDTETEAWCEGPSEGAIPRRIDWVIAGGESGPRARACELDWLRLLRDHCAHAGIPFFCKQLGSVLGKQLGAGPKGGDMSAWPEDLRIREFPRAAEAVSR